MPNALPGILSLLGGLGGGYMQGRVQRRAFDMEDKKFEEQRKSNALNRKMAREELKAKKEASRRQRLKDTLDVEGIEGLNNPELLKEYGISEAGFAKARAKESLKGLSAIGYTPRMLIENPDTRSIYESAYGPVPSTEPEYVLPHLRTTKDPQRKYLLPPEVLTDRQKIMLKAKLGGSPKDQYYRGHPEALAAAVEGDLPVDMRIGQYDPKLGLKSLFRQGDILPSSESELSASESQANRRQRAGQFESKLDFDVRKATDQFNESVRNRQQRERHFVDNINLAVNKIEQQAAQANVNLDMTKAKQIVALEVNKIRANPDYDAKEAENNVRKELNKVWRAAPTTRRGISIFK